ncbi:unnamed protein product [Rotaria sp. Silwood2]|nr:unnamed protein product [Rotaria sp. Silwood2]
MGAMRLPLDVHSMLNTYIRERLQLELEPYINYDPDTLVYINDVLTTRKQANDNPGQFNFNLYPNETNKSASTLWNIAVKPITDLFYADRWKEAVEKWDGYSIERYLLEVAHLSPDAIRFVSLLTNLETSLYTAILDNVLLHLIINDETTFYHIKGGNSGFTDALVRSCQAVPDGRCSIHLSTRVTAIELGNGSATVTYGSSFTTLSQNASETFDHVVIATTATAASLLDLKPRRRFIDTYYALRQLHYDCASKIGLYFTRQWWRNIGIDGGFSTSDLPVRTTIYFSFPPAPSPATLLASYAWSQDSIVWSTVPEDTAIAMALTDVQQLHTNINISQYFAGGITKHWCQDQYTQGGTFAQYAPYQQTKLKDLLAASVDNVHFTGEHISSAHAWIEGAILSALRLLMQIQEESFDVAIVGDDLISLITVLQIAELQPTWRIVLLSAAPSDNHMDNNSDEELSRFRPNDAAITQSIVLWRALEAKANVSNGTFLNLTNGYLLLTDENSTCSNNCQELDAVQIEAQFGFHNISRGLFYSSGGYVNITAAHHTLIQLLEKIPNVVTRSNEYFVGLDTRVSNSADHVRLITNRGSLNASRLVLIPGPNGNNVSKKFNFHLNLRLWELPTITYRAKTSSFRQLPTWAYDKSFIGLPLMASNDVRISPAVSSISTQLFTDPNQLTYVPDPLLIPRTTTWVIDHLSSKVNSSDYYVLSKTHIATRLLAGDVLDRLPPCARYRSKTFIYAGGSVDGSTSPLTPVWAVMLTQLVLGTSNNSIYNDLFSSMNAEKLTCETRSF